MNWPAISFDWNHARAFLATAEEGSLSAAERALDLTQPTLGRQVAALEDELGVMLFESFLSVTDPHPIWYRTSGSCPGNGGSRQPGFPDSLAPIAGHPGAGSHYGV